MKVYCPECGQVTGETDSVILRRNGYRWKCPCCLTEWRIPLIFVGEGNRPHLAKEKKISAARGREKVEGDGKG